MTYISMLYYQCVCINLQKLCAVHAPRALMLPSTVTAVASFSVTAVDVTLTNCLFLSICNLCGNLVVNK
jgi:hypothetical protein